MSNWVQIDLLDAIADAEAVARKKKEDEESLYPWEHRPVCEKWHEVSLNEYGDFVNNVYTFMGGGVKERRRVIINAAVKRPYLYYTFGVEDEKSAAYQPLVIDESQADGIYDGIDDIMVHVSKRLNEFCTGFDVTSDNIDRALNEMKKSIGERE